MDGGARVHVDDYCPWVVSREATGFTGATAYSVAPIVHHRHHCAQDVSGGIWAAAAYRVGPVQKLYDVCFK